MISKEQKEQIVAQYGRTAGDTGSPEVQIAILTLQIISKLIQRITTQEEDFLRW